MMESFRRETSPERMDAIGDALRFTVPDVMEALKPRLPGAYTRRYTAYCVEFQCKNPHSVARERNADAH